MLDGFEMRHTASLSPWALLRKWRFSVTVRHRSLHYRFSGRQTSYGRGLDLESARAACAMEIIERYSAFVSIVDDTLPELVAPPLLIFGRQSDLCKAGHITIDVKRLGLEADYTDQFITWIPARDYQENNVYVPLQSVCLFANYDEPALYSGLGSTGLASGTSREQAHLNAMLEVIERDADGTTCYNPACCFTLVAESGLLGELLAGLTAKDIHPWFQDITPEFGVPAYRCLVRGTDGTVYRGTSAHMDSRKALISALTETPYPYPNGPPSGKSPKNLPDQDVDSLPCWSSGSIKKDYRLLAELLHANGYFPVFADITRKDLDFAVTRAIIPGLEILSDFDPFSRVHPRLFQHYLTTIHDL